jgi:hypothetical protein
MEILIGHHDSLPPNLVLPFVALGACLYWVARGVYSLLKRRR